MASSASGQMELSCPLRTRRHVGQEKNPLKLYDISFIDQVCSVKMTGYWTSYFGEFMDLDSVPVLEHAKKGLVQCPAILTEQT